MVYNINGSEPILESELEHDSDVCDIFFCYEGKLLLIG
jgi:hypothetical protein